jgi:hypothetical protein
MSRPPRRRLVFASVLTLIAVLTIPTAHASDPQAKKGTTAGRRLGTAPAGQAQGTQMLDLRSLKASEVVVFSKTGGTEAFDPAATGSVALGTFDMALAVTGANAEQTQVVDPSGVSKAAWRLPFAFSMIAPARDTAAGAPSELLALEPIVEAAGGLRADPQGAGYVGRLFVGVVSLRDRTERLELPAPVLLLISSAQIDTIEPAQVGIGHTGLPFTEVALRTATPRAPASVKIRSSLTASGEADVPVPVALPEASLVASPERILGFGLETALISVQVSGLPNPNGYRVTLVPSDGRIEPPDPVQVDHLGFGTARLRSGLVGTAVVAAGGVNVVNIRSAQVTFGWPWVLLVSALAGGLLGRLLKILSPPRRRKTARTWIRELIVGAIAGLGATIMWAVGVYLVPVLPTVLTGAAAYFTVGFVGGLVGLVIPEQK